MKIVTIRSLGCIICILIIVPIIGLLWNCIPDLDPLSLWNTESDYDSYPTDICGIAGRQNAYHNDGNINHGIAKDQVTYILTAEFTGQQGAGIRGLLSQQCFSQHLDIPVSIVEPFLMNSILGHMRPSPNQMDQLRFSDMYNIQNFNIISADLGYSPLATWEDFLRNAREKTILVELQPGKKMMTKTIWETNADSRNSCYKGGKFSALKQLVTCAVCIVRIVKICCIHSQVPLYKSELTMKELQNALFGKWKPEEVNLLFTKWSAYWQVPSASCKEFNPIGNLHSSDQLLKHAIQYENLHKRSDQFYVAFVLRFEYLLREHYDVDECMHIFYETAGNWKSLNRSIFVAADIGRYRSNSWERSLSELTFKKASQFLVTFKNAVTLLIGNQWTFEEWENSFTSIAAGIEDNGYIAALQKTIASRADCIVFLVHGGNFQYLVMEEYVKHHLQSEQCIHYICDRKLQLQRPA